MAAIECPSCGKFLRRGSDSCSCGWRESRQLSIAGCSECHHENPVHRWAHWMDYDRSGLASHLQAEFDGLNKHADRLSIKLGQVAEYRARYTNKYADEFGQWLPPGLAYLKRMQACEPILGMALFAEKPVYKKPEEAPVQVAIDRRTAA